MIELHESIFGILNRLPALGRSRTRAIGIISRMNFRLKWTPGIGPALLAALLFGASTPQESDISSDKYQS